MRKILAALVALTFLSGPARAEEVASGTTTRSGKPPGATPAATWNGSTNYIWPSDPSGNPYATDPLINTSTMIPHYTNRTLAAGGTDSSLVPINMAGYRKVIARYRNRESTIASTASVELAVRGHSVAVLDSTQGWWFPLGLGAGRKGKTLPLTGFTERFQTFVLADSISGQEFQSNYMSFWVVNRTGAQIKYDLWFEGIR